MSEVSIATVEGVLARARKNIKIRASRHLVPVAEWSTLDRVRNTLLALGDVVLEECVVVLAAYLEERHRAHNDLPKNGNPEDLERLEKLHTFRLHAANELLGQMQASLTERWVTAHRRESWRETPQVYAERLTALMRDLIAARRLSEPGFQAALTLLPTMIDWVLSDFPVNPKQFVGKVRTERAEPPAPPDVPRKFIGHCTACGTVFGSETVQHRRCDSCRTETVSSDTKFCRTCGIEFTYTEFVAAGGGGKKGWCAAGCCPQHMRMQ